MVKNELIQTTQLLNAKTLGQMLALSKRQVFRLNSCGKIPAPIRIGGSVRWSAAEISSTIQIRLSRTDSTTGDIEATFVDGHVESNSFGSRQEYIK